jgi:tetratricopeptide (TPR) repeat protein
MIWLTLWLWLTPALAGDPEQWQSSYDAELRGEYAQALEALEGLTARERSTYVFHLRRGWLRYLAGAYPDAIAAYQEAARLAPNAEEPLLGLTLPQLALKRWVDAGATCRTILERDPGNATARVRLAWSLYNLGRYPEAEPLYRALVEDYPSDVDLQSGLGWSLLHQGKKADARRHFEAILAIAPAHAAARAGLDETGR